MEAEATSAFLFADLAGFTALTEAHGDREATEIAEDFESRVRATLPEYGGDLIKTIGDAVMVRLDSPDRAVELGLRIVEELARPGLPPVRVGIHCGSAIPRNHDWYGATVNLASRVSGAARTGEVLITEETKRCLEGGAYELEPRGRRYFKHIVEPVPVHRAIGEGGAGRHLEIDPVCRMAVDPQTPAATRHRRGETYYFCSVKCERSFEAEPRRYIATSPAARAARRGFLINLVFIFLGAIWVIALVVHYRAVRRVL